MKIRWSAQTSAVLAIFLQAPHEWSYGYDLSRETGLKSGTLYPILMRLEGHGLLETRWEMQETGGPARHLYKLTGDGLRFAREQVKLAVVRGVPVLGEARS